jgi:thiopeptide-type bacteriocin biosynthesis protein
MAGRHLYQHTDAALVRAAQHVDLGLPAWPDLTDTTPGHVERWCEWLREVWTVDAVADAIDHASPVLARQVALVCAGQRSETRQVQRMTLSVARYLLRMTGRATPFGLFAGVATASIGRGVAVRWGGGHRVIARAGAGWLADVVEQLESCPQVLERLAVVANNLCFVRGGRLVVPCQPLPHSSDRPAATEVSIRNTAAVRMAVESAATPILCSQLSQTLSAAFPTTPISRIRRLLTDLLSRRVVISNLSAPNTVTDAFEHLLAQLEAARAGEIAEVAERVHRLQEIAGSLARHNHAGSPRACRTARKTVVDQMTAVSAVATQPLALDLRLDCHLTLPDHVAHDAAAAAAALSRLTAHPFGTRAWQGYHTRFFERYGIGALVPVRDVVDPDIGLGFPAGYAGSAMPDSPGPLCSRDERLLALAQTAALDGRDEVVLDERLISELAAGDLSRAHMPPHAELCFELRSPSSAALERGEFELAIIGASRGVGTMTGRFISVLDQPEQRRIIDALARLPTSDPEALPAQLSFPPLASGAADVTRAPEVLPRMIGLAEHRTPSDTVIQLDDLAVGCDSHRLYLASLSLGRRLEPAILHALDLHVHTPPLARFLAELSRAHVAVLTGFDWGAARRLPYLPRMRYRRTVLSPARWLLDRADLPGRDAPRSEWEAAAAAWRGRRRLPDLVHLTEGDRRLTLDLSQPGHLVLLRTHLDKGSSVTLTEAPYPGAYGWFGGRSHEISLPLMTTQAARWPAAPQVSSAPVIRRGHGHPPAASRWLYAKLYGHPERQAEVVAEHLPELLSAWDEPPLWWFIRYRDPDWHLRLRISLPDATAFGPAAHRVTTWACQLQRRGLLRDVQFDTYRPEIGRWGDGPVMAAAEQVFAADSRALLAQFADPSRPHAQVMCTANFVAIATGFAGGIDAGMKWLIDHARPESWCPHPGQGVADTAVRLADPRHDWVALRTATGNAAVADAWAARRRTLADYRACIAVEGSDPGALLASLLHAHHVRAVGTDREDERTCLHLARSAALAWSAQAAGTRA